MEKKEPLFRIELDDMHSVPRIYHDGELIDALITVDFNWKTKDAENNGQCGYQINHCVLDNDGRPLATSLREVRS